MDMRFLALDVETANADSASICQVGIAAFEKGEVVDRWVSLVDPEGYFDPFHVGIHGIGAKDVWGAPTFRELYGEILERIEGEVVVHHMPFDRTALKRACERDGLGLLEAHWVDSAQVVRRTWEPFRRKGYGLANIAAHLGIVFQHHDALADAETAGKVFVAACGESGRSVEDWVGVLGKGPTGGRSKG